MKVINARNVNDALPRGIDYLLTHGVREESRAGPVLVAPEPVSTVYTHPQERVLFSAARDANCFFHLFESLWLLAGRNDARWLDQFVSDFSSRFAEEDGTLHGSYGFRWRHHFDLEGSGATFLPDQLNTIVEILRNNPQSRQAVLQMWDPVADLGQSKKDIPCNTCVYFRVRNLNQEELTRVGVRLDPAGRNLDGSDYHLMDAKVLDITVCCRSNDIIWGCYGANAVQFAFLLEYLAARIGVGIGTYTQVSHNYHMYLDMEAKATAILAEAGGPSKPYPGDAVPLVTDPSRFDMDLQRFFSNDAIVGHSTGYTNPFFTNIAVPLYWAHRNWKAKNYKAALALLETVQDSDWRLAAEQWIQRRSMAKKAMDEASDAG
jgi:thymidylate synthase